MSKSISIDVISYLISQKVTSFSFEDGEIKVASEENLYGALSTFFDHVFEYRNCLKLHFCVEGGRCELRADPVAIRNCMRIEFSTMELGSTADWDMLI